MTTVYSIEGVVKTIKKLQNGNSLITILSFSSNTEYKVVCTYFCPTMRGDIINGFCIQTDNGQYQFCRDPVVVPSSDEEAIKSTLKIYMKGTKLIMRTLSRVYDFFVAKAIQLIDEYRDKSLTFEDEESSIIKQKEFLPSAVMEVLSIYARKYQIDKDVASPLLELGLTEKQAGRLLTGWYKSFSLRRLYLLGLTRREIRESCERGFTPDTLYHQLVENPYLPERIPIEKSHKISQKFGLSFDQNMIESASLVRFVDKVTKENGWVCYPIYGLSRKYPRLPELYTTLEETFKCGTRYNFFYLRFQLQVEDRLSELLLPRQLNLTCASHNPKLSKEQIEAVDLSLNNKVSIITGGAGVGKTTVISAICSELDMMGEEYLVCSFTGKAVSRLKEVIGNSRNIMTLHMILSKGDLPDVDTLIIDEVSMVPNELLCRVLSKLTEFSKNNEVRVVLVGDPKQVQPIEGGDLFNQLLNSQIIPTCHLTHDHRRSGNGVLRQNMKQFHTVENPEDIIFSWGPDCVFEEGGIPEVLNVAKAIFSTGVPHTEITIVCPFNEELEIINNACQDIFLGSSPQSCNDSFGKVWKIGARVMMTTNRYDIGIMNGEEGIVTETSNIRVGVKFKNNKEVFFPTFEPLITEDNNLEEIEEPLSTKLIVLCWAISVHKSQGSEWLHVIFYLLRRFVSGFLNNKLLYTGISRARDSLCVVAPSEDNFKNIIPINPSVRYDNLSRRLRGEQ